MCVQTTAQIQSTCLKEDAKARERRGRTGFATNADQEEQNERPLSTELRGVGGRGRGRGRKEVTVLLQIMLTLVRLYNHSM